MAEPRVAAAGIAVEDDRMPMAEGTAANVLAGQATARAFEQKRCECEVLGGAPIDTFSGLENLSLLIEDEALDARMRCEPVGVGHQRLECLVELGPVETSVRVRDIEVATAFVVGPQPLHGRRDEVVCSVLSGVFERVLEILLAPDLDLLGLLACELSDLD